MRHKTCFLRPGYSSPVRTREKEGNVKKTLLNSASISIIYLMQRDGNYLYPKYLSFSVIFGETVITGAKCDISFDSFHGIFKGGGVFLDLFRHSFLKPPNTRTT